MLSRRKGRDEIFWIRRDNKYKSFLKHALFPATSSRGPALCQQGPSPERDFFIDNPLVRIHLIIEMILVDRPCVMGV